MIAVNTLTVLQVMILGVNVVWRQLVVSSCRTQSWMELVNKQLPWTIMAGT